MTFSSADSYRDFDRSVKGEFRYLNAAHQKDFLGSLRDSCHLRCQTMSKGTVLWRAQLGHCWHTLECDCRQFEFPFPYPPQRMKPKLDGASDGRANPRGIPYLYMATEKETAALEVRPVGGSYISLAGFQLRKEVRLVDCSSDRADALFPHLQENKTPKGIEAKVWSDINRAFSKPVARGDDSLDYVPTQIIAEAFKLNGFDGIIYKSGYGETGLNVMLFDLDAANITSIGLFRVEAIGVKLTQEPDPHATRYLT